jgi:hypothetical protein
VALYACFAPRGVDHTLPVDRQKDKFAAGTSIASPAAELLVRPWPVVFNPPRSGNQPSLANFCTILVHGRIHCTAPARMNPPEWHGSGGRRWNGFIQGLARFCI